VTDYLAKEQADVMGVVATKKNMRMLGSVWSDGAGASAVVAGGGVGRRGGCAGVHAARRLHAEKHLDAAQRVYGRHVGGGGRACWAVWRLQD